MVAATIKVARETTRGVRFPSEVSMKVRSMLWLIPALTLMGCPSKKDSALDQASADFMSEAQKLEWYGPAREALILAVMKWHSQKGTPVSSASALSGFTNAPFEFTVGGGKYAQKRRLPWSAVQLEPRGRDQRDPRFYVYGIVLLGVKGSIGAEGLPKADPN